MDRLGPPLPSIVYYHCSKAAEFFFFFFFFKEKKFLLGSHFLGITKIVRVDKEKTEDQDLGLPSM